jgi:RNA polymerase sigma-70 factor, ECF subfamily
MSIPPPDSAVALPVRAAAPERALGPSELEREIISLFDQFRSRLLRYVVSLGVPAHDGEEIIQEVFTALFLHLHRGRSRTNLRGWIFRVAHNLALKHCHANHKARDIVESDKTFWATQSDPAPNPEEQMVGSQRQERLRAILRALPRQDQCCLYLRAEGLRYREIAEILGMSLGAISISLTKSLARMRRADEGENYVEQ